MNNKKKLHFIVPLSIIVFFIFALYSTARLMNWFQFYSIPTTNMDPTLKIGDKIYGTCLTNYLRNDIITYNAAPLPFDETQEQYIAICRIVGIEGDKIQLKNGLLFLNDTLIDDTMNLSYNFIINYKNLTSTFSKYDAKHKVFQLTDSTFILNFTYNQLNNYHLISNCIRYIDTTTIYIKPQIFGEEYKNYKWSNDNFGPVLVPKNHLFLIGDNRSNSADSRIRGFIPFENVLTKIISY